jgi:hypothetical protein
MTKGTTSLPRGSSTRELGKNGTRQRNKDRLGSTSGPMGPEDQRKDKYGSVHNQDPQGLMSPETQMIRELLSGVRQHQFKQRRHRNGSRK